MDAIISVFGFAGLIYCLWLVFSKETDNDEPAKTNRGVRGVKTGSNVFPAYLVPRGYWVEHSSDNSVSLVSEDGGHMLYELTPTEGWKLTSCFRGKALKDYSNVPPIPNEPVDKTKPVEEVEEVVKNPNNTTIGEDGKRRVKPFYALEAKEWVLAHINAIGDFVTDTTNEKEAVFNENLPKDKEALAAIVAFLNSSDDCGEDPEEHLYRNVELVPEGLKFSFNK